MNCLMIGGAGFIGAYATRALLNAGHRVVIYDAIVGENSLGKILTPDELSQLTLLHGDITDLPSLIRAMREQEIDSLVHLASWQIPGCQNNPTQAILVNGLGFNHTLEAAASLGVRRMVWTSTNAVFGSPAFHPVKPLPNDDFQKPNTVYGALKSLNEYMAEHFFKHRGVDSIGLRFCLVYGYGRMRGASAFASEMIQKAALGEPCVVENGDSLVDWYYVADAGELILRALTAPTTITRVFNTHSELHTVREATEALVKLVPGAQVDVKPGAIDANWHLESSRLEQELGFKPRYHLEDGLRDALALARQQAGLPPLPGIHAVDHYSN